MSYYEQYMRFCRGELSEKEWQDIALQELWKALKSNEELFKRMKHSGVANSKQQGSYPCVAGANPASA